MIKKLKVDKKIKRRAEQRLIYVRHRKLFKNL